MSKGKIKLELNRLWLDLGSENFLGMESPEKGIASTLILYHLFIKDFATQFCQ